MSPTERTATALLAAAGLAAAAWWASRPPPPAAPAHVVVVGRAEWPPVQEMTAFLGSAQAGIWHLPPLAVERVDYLDDDRLRAELRRRHAELAGARLLYVPSQSIARVVQQEFPATPIVFDGVDDPVAMCLVDSLTRPGRNATGYMHYLDQSELTMMRLLRDAFPALREVLIPLAIDNVRGTGCDPRAAAAPAPPARVCGSGWRGADAAVERSAEGARLEGYGRELGLVVRFVIFCNRADFARLPALAAGRADAGFLVPWHSLFADNARALVDAIAVTRLPAIFPRHAFAQAGGLMSLEPLRRHGNDRESFRQIARVLSGHEPAGLPVYSPAGYSLIVNARAAARDGLRPSLALLRRADEVMQ